MDSPSPQPTVPRHGAVPLSCDMRGTVLIEAAFVLPLVIALLFGILIYGTWFMTAHLIQQAASDAARSALAGLTDTERRTLVDQAVTRSLAGSSWINTQKLQVTTPGLSAGYYNVRLTYDLQGTPLFATSLVPLPTTSIQREAVVKVDTQ